MNVNLEEGDKETPIKVLRKGRIKSKQNFPSGFSKSISARPNCFFSLKIGSSKDVIYFNITQQVFIEYTQYFQYCAKIDQQQMVNNKSMPQSAEEILQPAPESLFMGLLIGTPSLLLTLWLLNSSINTLKFPLLLGPSFTYLHSE